MLKGLLLAPEPDGLSGAGVGRGGGRLGSCGGHCEKRCLWEMCKVMCKCQQNEGYLGSESSTPSCFLIPDSCPKKSRLEI